MTGADFYQGEDEMKEDETRISYPILCDMVAGVLTAAGVPVEMARWRQPIFSWAYRSMPKS